MDMSSIAGAALLMKASQTQEAMSVALMKQAAEQQTQVASMLAQLVATAAQPVPDSSYAFSIYA
ncbi:hypothetical protein [Pelobacter propionicus]|uniref:hypothetical protein n=1 Tax=Pelobacter propionicus TaxID=29543 RepID=UPI0003184929|nr:hypothetical protein [Pelobacter propionicus]